MSTSSSKAECTEVVRRADGLHARPSADFVKLAQTFRADVSIRNLSRVGDREHNAKSLTDLLFALIDNGHMVQIVANGSDAEAAIGALCRFIGAPQTGGDSFVRLGNAFRRSTASLDEYVHRNVPYDWPTEDWGANYWTVTQQGRLVSAQAIVQLPEGFSGVCRRVELGESGCIQHVRRWGVACRMSLLEAMGFDPSELPASRDRQAADGSDVLYWMIRATHFDLPGDFVIASSEHPFLLFRPDGTLGGCEQNWFTYLGALAFYVSEGNTAKPFSGLWQGNQRLYQSAVFYLLRALGGQDDSQAVRFLGDSS